MVFGVLGSNRLRGPSAGVIAVLLASGCSLDVSGAAPEANGRDGATTGDGGHLGGGASYEAGSAIGPGDDAGSVDSDAGEPPSEASGPCDLHGTWANLLTIDVSWAPQGVTGVFLAPGAGQIRQWIRSVRTPGGRQFTDNNVVCGVQLPDFDGSAFAGGEHYGVRFPDSLFDSRPLAPFTLTFSLSASAPGGRVTSPTAGVLLGLTMASPKTDPWPTSISTPSDDDGDGFPGVTVTLAQGPGYNDLPIDLAGGRADRLDLAIRQLSAASGTVDTCDQITGTVTIPTIKTGTTMKPAIDSHVIGCSAVDDAGACSAQSAAFIDATQPVFLPSGSSTFTSVRVPDGADCAAVRKAFP